MKGLYGKEEKLVLEYIDKQYKNKQSGARHGQKLYLDGTKTSHKKDSILARLYDVPDPLLWQIAKVRNLGFSLQNIKTRSIAREYVDGIKQKLTHPQLVEEAEYLFAKTHPKEKSIPINFRKAKPPTFSATLLRIIREKSCSSTSGQRPADLVAQE